jgi:hypothetical protein
MTIHLETDRYFDALRESYPETNLLELQNRVWGIQALFQQTTSEEIKYADKRMINRLYTLLFVRDCLFARICELDSSFADMFSHLDFADLYAKKINSK